MSIADKLQTIAKNEQRVFEAGKKSEYDRFWDNYQQKGKRVNYELAFAGLGWSEETFKPKYNIQPTNAYMMFRGSQIADLYNKSIQIDFSKLSGAAYMFQYAQQLQYIGSLNFTNVTGLDSTFYSCKNLLTIEKMILKESNSFGGTFTGCTSLQNIIIEGTIGNNFDIKQAPLTKESIISIINALSPTASGKTVTFKKSAVDTAFETTEGLADGSTSEEWVSLRATKSNWTISLV